MQYRKIGWKLFKVVKKSDNNIEVFLKLQEKFVDFKSCNVQRFYHYFSNSIFKKPLANQLWLRHFNEIEEKDIWKNMKWIFMDTDLECLDFKTQCDFHGNEVMQNWDRTRCYL